MSWPKFVILGLHSIGIVLAGYVLLRLQRQGTLGDATRDLLVRVLSRHAFFLVLWNVVILIAFAVYVDGIPLSPAGYIIWPSLVVHEGMKFWLRYRTVVERERSADVSA